MKGFLALVKTIVRSSFRNRAALIFTLLIPIFLMVLLGNVLGGGNASVNIGVVDQAGTSLSKAYITTLKHDKNLVVEEGSASHEFRPSATRRRHCSRCDPSGLRDALFARPEMPGQRCDTRPRQQ